MDCTGHTPQLSVLCVWERESGWFRQQCGLYWTYTSAVSAVSLGESGWFHEHCGLYWTYTSAVSAVCLGEREWVVSRTLWTVLNIHLSCQCCESGREWVVSRTIWTVLDIHLSCQCCVSGRESGWFRQHCGLYWTYTSAVSAVCLGERVGGFANFVDCTGHTPQLSML